MSLAEQLSQASQSLARAPSPIRKIVISSRDEHIATFDPKQTIQPGTRLPSFRLPDATGNDVSSADLLAKGGPLVLTVYRGGWCPFCNLALRAMQHRLPDLQSRNATLVAITPELPDHSLTTTQKNELAFSVLTDVGNGLARELGIVWRQPDEMREAFTAFGNDLKARNGDDSLELPVPTTLLVDGDGVVRNIHAEADYTKRLDPEIVLGWLDALN